MTLYAASRHIGTREYQQDTVEAGIGQDGLLYGILCDGMGGLEDGELASRTAAQSLAGSLRELEPDAHIPAFLAERAHYLNRLVGGLNGAGTTLTAAVMAGDRLFWLSVGDSRAFIIRGGEIVCVTRDHSYSLTLEEMVRAGKLTAEAAAADPLRDALISYLGMDGLEIIDGNRNAFALRDGDTVLLCSDGLYRSLSDPDILDVVTRHDGDLEECARVLPLYAFDRSGGSQDNTSVVLLRYQDGQRTIGPNETTVQI
jgi:protein phosphatase